MKSIDILFLSRADVVSLNLGPSQVIPTIEKALLEHSNGTYEMHPKIGVHPTTTDPGNFIHAMPAYLHQLKACGLKWVGGFASNDKLDLPNVTGVQIYNDTLSGIPLAIMDCSYLTGLRTAAVSALIATVRSFSPRRSCVSRVRISGEYAFAVYDHLYSRHQSGAITRC
jgi:ornithine cyclodeaminase/alanine dehydrogenase-like protein (mu-crystallin family)